MLDADWFGPDTERGRENAIWSDAIKALAGDISGNQRKNGV